MKVRYADVKEFFRDKKIAFSNKGWVDRHKDDDLLEVPNFIQLEPNTAFLGGSTLFDMGSFSYSWSALPAYAKVGRYCSIARGVTTVGVRHPYEWVSTSSFSYDNNFCIFRDADFDIHRLEAPDAKLEIGHDVWIGANVLLARNLSIGTGAVIAANSVVTKDVQPYEIVGGNPARHIKFRFPEPVRQALLASAWWQYHYEGFNTLDIKNPEVFAEQLKQLQAEQKIQPYQPEKIGKRMVDQWLLRL